LSVKAIAALEKYMSVYDIGYTRVARKSNFFIENYCKIKFCNINKRLYGLIFRDN